MIYKFRSKAAGDLIMLATNGDQVLRLIGKEPGHKGIIEVDQMPAAIAALEAAVVADEQAFEALCAQAREQGQEPPRRQDIGLRQRAWPMVEMLRRAHAHQHHITWGV